MASGENGPPPPDTGRLFAALAEEMRRLDRHAEDIEDALGLCLQPGQNDTGALLVKLQAVDALRQNVADLSRLFDALSGLAGGGWIPAVTLDEALSSLKQTHLSARLKSADPAQSDGSPTDKGGAAITLF